jgi:predicted DNA-binding transcriptional regulator AlpA
MPATGVFDVSTFCESHKISRSFLYKLIAEGRGPRLMKLGRRTLISVEAASEWRARMEVESPQPIGAVQS